MAIENAITQVVLPAAVVAVMFAVGTTLGLDDLRRVVRRPRGFLFGFLAHTFLLPALAFGVAAAMALPGPIAAGLVLIAACPASVAAAVATHLARGDTMLSVCMTAAASLASVVTVPAFVAAALSLFPAGAGAVRLPILPSALGVFAVATLPVLAGMRLRAVRPGAARVVEARLGGAGLVVIVLVVTSVIWSERANLAPAFVRAGAPALVTNALAISGAWGASYALGLSRGQRIAIALECGLQNFALAAFVALTLTREPILLLPGLAYGIVMWLSAAALVVMARRPPSEPQELIADG